MESIYYVMCFACHRRCKHCYEDRFRPYVRDKLAAVVAEAKANYARIIDHFPDRMTYLDLADPAEDGTLPEKTGRVILYGPRSRTRSSSVSPQSMPGAAASRSWCRRRAISSTSASLPICSSAVST